MKILKFALVVLLAFVLAFLAFVGMSLFTSIPVFFKGIICAFVFSGVYLLTSKI